MIFFGHLGVTLGVTGAADKAMLLSGKNRTGAGIDYRILLLGSMLPDLVDKPILFFLNNEHVKSGKMIGHSLLFLFILAGISLFIRVRNKKSWVLVLAFGSLMHLLLDEIWNHMNAFLWPVFAGEQNDLSLASINEILTDPHLYVPEIVGFTILLIFASLLIKRKQVRNFLKTGKTAG